MYFDTLVLGNYLSCASPLLRADISKVLLRFKTRSRENGSILRVISSNKDSLHPLVLRACHSLNIQVEVADAPQLKQLAKKSFVLMYKVICPSAKSEKIIELMEAFSTYVEGILDYLEVDDVATREIKVEESMLVKSPLPDGIPVNQGVAPTLDYSQIMSYIDNWFEGVRSERTTPSMDRDKIPSKDQSPNTWLTGNPSQT